MHIVLVVFAQACLHLLFPPASHYNGGKSTFIWSPQSIEINAFKILYNNIVFMFLFGWLDFTFKLNSRFLHFFFFKWSWSTMFLKKRMASLWHHLFSDFRKFPPEPQGLNLQSSPSHDEKTTLDRPYFRRGTTNSVSSVSDSFVFSRPKIGSGLSMWGLGVRRRVHCAAVEIKFQKDRRFQMRQHK